MGVGRLLELPEHQVQILDAYGIDPYNRRLPADIMTAARAASRILGPKLDLVIDLDFLVDTAGKCLLNDVNPNPGTPTFAFMSP